MRLKHWFSLKVYLKRRNFGKFGNMKVKTLIFMVILEICLFYPIFPFRFMKLRNFSHENALKFRTFLILCYDGLGNLFQRRSTQKRVKWNDFKRLTCHFLCVKWKVLLWSIKAKYGHFKQWRVAQNNRFTLHFLLPNFLRLWFSLRISTKYL